MARLNPSPIRMYRGTTAQHSQYAGPVGELTVDTDKNTVVVQNGTQGGVPLAQEKRQVIAGDGIKVNGGASGTLASDLTVAVDTEWLAENVPAGEQGPQGDPGPAGADGAAATITVGSVTTGAAGTQASVTNAGTSSAAVLNFTIPRGAKGDKGEKGERGPQGEQGPAGADGADGARGPQGPAGADGAAATIAVGTVTTGAAGSKAIVTNEGTSSAAVFNFTIPQGAKGAKGDKGEKGDTGPQGERGPAGADGADGARGPQGEQGPVGPAGEYTAGTGITISGDTLSVNTSWLTTQINNRIAADHQAFLPLYFTADSLELHSFVPAGVTKVKYSAIEADGSGTSGLTLKMGRDIGSTASMNVTGTAANCSSYAGHSVTFTLSGLGNQTEIAVMIEFA